MTQLAHKIRLYPNKDAISYFQRCAGTARFAWNWALASWKKKYDSGERNMSGYSLVKEFNALKGNDFPWTSEITKWAPQKAIQNLGDAFKKFFKKQTRYPKFKKKGVTKDSFYLGVGAFKIDGKRIKIPKLGWVKMAQNLRFPGTPKFVVISREADQWFAAISVEIDEGSWVYPHCCETQATVGIDLGISDTIILDNQIKLNYPKSLDRLYQKIRQAQRDLSRKTKGSSNREKAKLGVSRLWVRVRRIRQDWTHRVTSGLVSMYRWIGMEDLNIKGMMKLRSLSRKIGEACWGEIKRQLGYKSELAGSQLVLADRFFPSSKLCSSCGHKVDKLPLDIREWECPVCGALHDRDVNAAKNLSNVARRYRENLNVCGGEVSPDFQGEDLAFPMKQKSGVLGC